MKFRQPAALCLLLLLALQPATRADQLWRLVRVAVSLPGFGTTAELQIPTKMRCAAYATSESWPNLYCYDGSRCSVSDVKVQAPHDDSANGPVLSCYTKLGPGDVACYYPFLEKTAVGCFLIVETPKNWDDAQTHCQASGAALATPTDFTAFRSFIGTQGLSQEAWVGVVQRKWTDNRPLPSSDWIPSDPNGPLTDCGRLMPNSGYLLADRGCSSTFAFVCEIKLV